MTKDYKKPIHLTEMKKQLDIAKIRAQLVNLRCWELKSGDIIEYRGWLVIGSHWRGGTHRGSQSSRIAAYLTGHDYTGCEIDPWCFKKGNERFDRECHGIIKTNGTTIKQESIF